MKIAVIGPGASAARWADDGARPGTRWCTAPAPAPARGQVAPLLMAVGEALTGAEVVVLAVPGWRGG